MPPSPSTPFETKPPAREASMLEELIVGFDRALRTLAGVASSGRPNPAGSLPEPDLSADDKRHAAGLMRVNHTGEVCAQALYQAQALTARDAGAAELAWPVRVLMRGAARLMTLTAYRL